mgnify:CR=1 FL=1
MNGNKKKDPNLLNTDRESMRGYGVDDYSKVVDQQPQQPQSGDNQPTTSSTDDYFQMARDQEYGMLFDKEVALENAKANALKYAKNQINAQGFGGTGYGSTMQGGIYNDYMNRVGEANNEYNANIRDINRQEKEANEAETAMRTGNVTSMLQSATSVDQMNGLLEEYGYGYTDKNGEFHLNDVKPEGMSDDEWIQLKYFYNAQKDMLSSGGKAYNSYDSLLSYMATLNGYTDRDGTPTQTFEAETKTLWEYASAGRVENGAVVYVKNGQGNVVYLKWTENGYVPVTESEYNNASKKYSLVREGKVNHWTTVK